MKDERAVVRVMDGQKPQRNTELDDEIEQILSLYISDIMWRTAARNDICAAIAARGYDVFARPLLREAGE